MDILETFFIEHLGDWLISALIIIGVASLARFGLFLVDHGLLRLANRTKTKLDDVLISRLKGPLFVLAILLGIQVALMRLTFLEPQTTSFLHDVLYVSYVLVGYFLVFQIFKTLLTWYIEEVAVRTTSRIDDEFAPFIRRLMLLVLTGIAIILVLDHFGINIFAFVATLGVGSLAVALAAQETLSDAIAGFVIMFDRPFRLGDRIEIEGRDLLGDVYEIGLRSTKILTPDHRLIVVPNSMIGKSLVVNQSYPEPDICLQLPFGVSYESDLHKVKAVVIETVRRVPGVLSKPEPQVHFLGFGDSALNLQLRCWLPSPTDIPGRTDAINMAIYDAFKRAGIEIPFPHRTVYHRLEPSEKEFLVNLINGRRRDT